MPKISREKETDGRILGVRLANFSGTERKKKQERKEMREEKPDAQGVAEN